MKKTLAILLALVLVLANVAALASEVEEPAAAASQVTPLAPQNIILTKEYVVEGTTAVNAADTLTFTIGEKRVENATAGVTAPDISIANVTVDSEAEKAEITIALPEYTSVGEYYYQFSENDTGVAGVTYLADPIYMKVQVLVEPETKALTSNVKFRLGSEDAEEKIESFENKYEAGSLTVSKTVSGNMGDLDKDWNFTVVFTAPEGDTVVEDITVTAEGGATAPAAIAGGWSGTTTKTSTFVLKNGQSVKFSNIPKGVTYTVEEAEADQDDYVTTITGIDKNGGSGDIETSEDDTVAFTNTKDVEIDTGIAVESVPYIMILAVVMIGAALLVLRKREEY